MSEKVQSLTNRVLSLVKPVTATTTFMKRPMAAALAGGAPGVVSYYKDNIIPNWHGPTLEGFMNALASDLGFGLVNTALGAGINYVGDIADISVVKTIGKAIQDGGEGQAIGGLADMVVHAPEFNPGTHSGPGSERKGTEWWARPKGGKPMGGKGREKTSSAPGRGAAHRAVTGALKPR